jgi:Ca2+-binding RTX toxin-like protein
VLARLFALMVAGVLMPAAYDAAVAADPMCQGRPATMVGSPGGRLTGTDGPDVIVSNGARVVDAGDGDDRICLTGPRPGRAAVRVLAHGGDDRVRVDLDRRATTITKLGSGDDTFLGGPGADQLIGELLGVDVIRTAGGPDLLRAFDSGPMDDRIALGGGADQVVFSASGVTDGAELDGDAGRDHMYISRNSDGVPMVVDNVTGTLSIDGTPQLRWEGFEEFEVTAYKASRLDLIGGDASEEFIVPYDGIDTASLGGGDDFLGVNVAKLASDHDAVLNGGRGLDHLAPTRTSGSASVDLTADTAQFSDPGVTARVPGFENASVTAKQVRLVGDDGVNRLAGYGCDTKVIGSGGDDVLAYARPFTTLFDCSIRTVLRGGPGDDLLLGGPRADLLYGNAGSDIARAGGGRDLCRSIERKKGCERS